MKFAVRRMCALRQKYTDEITFKRLFDLWVQADLIENEEN